MARDAGRRLGPCQRRRVPDFQPGYRKAPRPATSGHWRLDNIHGPTIRVVAGRSVEGFDYPKKFPAAGIEQEFGLYTVRLTP